MSGVPSPPAVMSEHAQEMLKKLNRFVEEVVKPGEVQYREQHSMGKNRWACPPVMEAMKAEAKKRELWNLFVPRKFKESPGLTTFEYAHLCEVMGKHLLAAEATNCSAPDTGNMEVLLLAGNAEQKERWLKPLLEGRIRSTFLMTEPNVASSDASNISIDITRDGDDYVINGAAGGLRRGIFELAWGWHRLSRLRLAASYGRLLFRWTPLSSVGYASASLLGKLRYIEGQLNSPGLQSGPLDSRLVFQARSGGLVVLWMSAVRWVSYLARSIRVKASHCTSNSQCSWYFLPTLVAAVRDYSQVPMDTQGIRVVRALTVFGYDDAPHGHALVEFNNVRLKRKDSLLANEGDGFKIAQVVHPDASSPHLKPRQARLGPGRIHHCMRAIGMAERALEIAVDRAHRRKAFGKL